MESISNLNISKIDWQGHRGCRGIMPENSLPAFLKALEFPLVKTLELDLAMSKDGQIVVSHEPWMNHEIASKPDGSPVTEAEAMALNLYKMNYADIKNYDCGMRGHGRFPEQKKLKVYKPTLAEVVKTVDDYCEKQGIPSPRFNIEIKSDERGDNIFHPTPAIFTEKVIAEIKRLNVTNRTCLQSFDMRVVREIHQQDATITLALLIENIVSMEKNIEKLGFTPDIYSCYFKLLTKRVVEKCHAKKMKVIPWTVNTVDDMEKMLRFGVDGIITDYPNLIDKIGK